MTNVARPTERLPGTRIAFAICCPRRILAAAERRAKSIGVGAERVLICADAITEEAYLTALANSLGTVL